MNPNARNGLTEDGGPAFPGKTASSNGYASGVDGMSLRDYFAAHAKECDRISFYVLSDGLMNPAWRYRYADAMLKARKP